MKMSVAVTQYVDVVIPDALLTEEFMAQFAESFYPFTNAEQHFEHIAQMHARGLVDNNSFIEGYGDAKSRGIKMMETDLIARVD